ncbi:MAG TPA: nucleoside hydrolase, partial [Bacillota bacterium]
LRVLEAVGAAYVPVAVGCDRPLVGPPRDARAVHGHDGLGNARLPAPGRRPSAEHAVDQLLRVTRERPGEITIVALGPLTNLAVALAKDAGLVRRVRQVVVMGGALRPPGNVTAVAEANIAHDPEAAQAVLTAGWPLLLVSLDVTMRAVLSEERARCLATADDPAARLAWAILPHYFDVYRRVFGRRQCPLHDPLALACAFDRSLVVTRRARVEVELDGRLTRGMTVADLRAARDEAEDGPERAGASVEVCLDVAAERFVELLMRRLGAA